MAEVHTSMAAWRATEICAVNHTSKNNRAICMKKSPQVEPQKDWIRYASLSEPLVVVHGILLR